MIVGKHVFSVADIAARENTRYAINGVRFRRAGDVCQADATDGRVLMRVEWSDEYDRQETPAPQGLELSDVAGSVDGFETIIGVDQCKRVAKAIPKRAAMKDQFKRAILPESAVNGRAPFHIADGSGIVDDQTLDGAFPNIDGVIPAFDTSPGLTESADGAAVTIGVNPSLLARLCKALESAACDVDTPGIRLTVPVDPGRPMLLSAGRIGGTTATGVIMPVRIGGEPSARYSAMKTAAIVVSEIARALASGDVQLAPKNPDDTHARTYCRELADMATESAAALNPSDDSEESAG